MCITVLVYEKLSFNVAAAFPIMVANFEIVTAPHCHFFPLAFPFCVYWDMYFLY